MDSQEKGFKLDNYYGYCNIYDDTGILDIAEKDIDNDGDLQEMFSVSTRDITVIQPVSSHQDLQMQVQTDKNIYKTGTGTSSVNSSYSYKLRARNGNNKVSNFIIYDNLESAYEDKAHWNGEFLGIDTSYAESKGYTVKTYYSENAEAGNLYNDKHNLNPDWKEYYEEIDTNPQTIASPNWPNNYPNGMTEENDYWEVSKPGTKSLKITFDESCELESASYDYLRFYDKSGNNITASVCGISLDKIGGTDFAGKTYTIPGDYIKISMTTDRSATYKGFSATVTPIMKDTYIVTDKTKVKSLAFEFLDNDGNLAIIPENSFLYVLINMKSPESEKESYCYNRCRTQWNAIDEFGLPIEFITGMDSNITKIKIEQEYGSYVIKHEYYKKYGYDDGKLHVGSSGKNEVTKLEKIEYDEEVMNIPSNTIIDVSTLEHKFMYNGKEYDLLNDNNSIMIEANRKHYITIKYIRKDLSFYLEWDDDNDLDGQRPDIYLLNVVTNKTKVEDTFIKNNNEIFFELDEKYKDIEKIDFNVSAGERYYIEYDEDRNVYIAHYIKPSFSVFIPKLITLDGCTGEGSYDINVELRSGQILDTNVENMLGESRIRNTDMATKMNQETDSAGLEISDTMKFQIRGHAKYMPYDDYILVGPDSTLTLLDRNDIQDLNTSVTQEKIEFHNEDFKKENSDDMIVYSPNDVLQQATQSILGQSNKTTEKLSSGYRVNRDDAVGTIKATEAQTKGTIQTERDIFPGEWRGTFNFEIKHVKVGNFKIPEKRTYVWLDLDENVLYTMEGLDGCVFAGNYNGEPIPTDCYFSEFGMIDGIYYFKLFRRMIL